MTEQHVRVIHEQKRGRFNAAEFWENYPIPVPPVAPSELYFCNIIDVSYEIRVSLKSYTTKIERLHVFLC